MTSKEIREKFLEFFREKEHTIIPSASLIPSETDPTALFTTAGMHPLVPYLLGEEHPGGKRVANSQKCVRTIDIDEVGDNSHLTFFEMLGNWSFGDYFKSEAIEWSWEFLISSRWLGLNPEKIAVSVFTGDNNAPFDSEAFEIWKKLGVPEKRIARLPKENNWWGPAGAMGPCGPDTEMFYWIGDSEQAPEYFDPNDSSWMEIWNDVFMEYNKNSEGKYVSLKQKNVDTGMGLERIAMVMQDKNSVFETDLFAPVIEAIKSKILNSKSQRIIADHIKASAFILAEGVEPSNIGRGYVLRRLIRRAIRYGYKFDFDIEKEIIKIYKDFYPEIEKNKNFIKEQISKEEENFKRTLERGLKEFEKGTDPFILFTTYGFPVELTQEMAKEKGIEVDMKKFNEQLKQHQDLSRTASAGMFKGGLADAGEQTTKYHTATHLLLAALRKVLGEHIAQKGSNITSERMRLDFSHPQKMTDDEIKKVEGLVNEKIKENLAVSCEEMSVEEAKEKGALGVFKSKYGDKVKVYRIGNPAKGGQVFSMEICGGPHVKSTAELGRLKILKEESVSAGARRIKAVLE